MTAPALPAPRSTRAAIAIAVEDAEVLRDVEHHNQFVLALAALKSATLGLTPGTLTWLDAVTPILRHHGTQWAATDARHQRTVRHLTAHPDVIDLTDRALARAAGPR